MPTISRYIDVDGEQVSVSEEVYLAYKRPAWAEYKRKEREKRCRDESGNQCTKDCRLCSKERTGGVLSLDRFVNEGFEVADPVDLTELVADKLLLEELCAALEELEPDDRSLIDALFYDERTERDYAREIGLSHQSVNKRRQKVIEKLRRLMKINF